MDLDVVAFPALIIANDGWVSLARHKEEISEWTPSAIAKYRARQVVLYDSENHAWEVESIARANERSTFGKVLAVLRNAKTPVQLNVRLVARPPVQVVHEILMSAVDADDDILTHWTEAADLKKAIQETDSFATLVRVLKEKRAI